MWSWRYSKPDLKILRMETGDSRAGCQGRDKKEPAVKMVFERLLREKGDARNLHEVRKSRETEGKEERIISKTS